MTTAAIERDNTVNITHDVLLAKDSLQRCLSKPEFLDIFYEKFLASSDVVMIISKLVCTNSLMDCGLNSDMSIPISNSTLTVNG